MVHVQFNGILSYKVEEAGGWARKVNPRNTSQVCSECGARPPTIRTLEICFANRLLAEEYAQPSVRGELRLVRNLRSWLE